MITKIVWPWELPEVIDGVAVVADVWAATTNISTFLRKGVKQLLLVNTLTIQKAKKEYKNALLIGESFKLPRNLFDASNYPSDIEKLDIKNQTVLYMSNNGSRIIESVLKKRATDVITVSFTNITSVSEYLKGFNEIIYLIPSGEITMKDQRAEEDLIYVESLDRLLKRKRTNLISAQEKAKTYIISAYGDQHFDRDYSFSVVFNINSTTSVPVCRKNAQSFIEIFDLNTQKRSSYLPHLPRHLF